jgi:sugar phosphate isomerase/epimerase
MMRHPSRRRFLQTATLLMAAGFTGFGFDTKPEKLKLSFSTLGCPDWDLPTIVNFAAAHGYTGIELRGIQRELDLTKVTIFNSAASRAATIALMNEKNLDEGKRFIDLAQQINCPFIRVFPNNFPNDQDKQTTMELITSGLLELADYAKHTNITVLMETHGDLVKSEDLLTIMQAAEHPNAGLVWDVANMWNVTKEPPAQVYEKLKKYIRHTHIKDAKMVDGKLQYTFLGKGEVPIFTAIDLLRNDRFRGYYSFEWEKLWHPEIEASDLAFADYAKKMKDHFNH